MNLKNIANQIKKCKKCPLYKNRKHAVPGEGPKNAKIMFIGQAPGKQEDLTGKPFIGKAGEFFNQLLKQNKIQRKKCFITSVVKCFPPKNRKPKPAEAKTCTYEYLIKQIKIINPKTIVLMGKIAQKYVPKELLKNKKIIKTFHPAAGMRFPKIRIVMFKDFEKIKK
jgi:DNA polymerase